MTGVHQFLATFEPGAIGDHAIRVQNALRNAGYESEIFAEYAKGGFENQFHHYTTYGKKVRAGKDDLLMYHMAIGSNVADWLNDVPKQRFVMAHHNITPVEFYEAWDPGVTYGMAWGREQLAKLAKRATLGIGMSEYNRRELDELHYANTVVSPLLIDFDVFGHSVDAAASARLQARKANGGSDWLFVGWIAPHKCQHDIIRAFALYRRLYDANAHLYFVGRTGTESYFDACTKLVAQLGLTDAVTFTGRVSDGELGAYYATADVLVSMSEHEGVGIPLLEAMYNGVPIVAYAAAAVPETVGGAGIVLAEKKPAKVAAAAARVVNDHAVRDSLISAGKSRLELFSLPVATERLLHFVGSV